MTISRHALVGLMFLTALVLLGVVTVKVTSWEEILGKEPYFLDVVFFGSAADAEMARGKGGVGGLERNDPVLISGVEVGRVASVTLDGAQFAGARPGLEQRFKVLVRLELKREYRIRQDYAIRIVDSSLLGGKQIEIDPGSGAVVRQSPLKGRLLPSAIQAFSEVVDRNAENFNRIMKNIAEISSSVKEGDGTVGRLVRDSELHDKMVSVVDRADRILKAVEQGPGLVNTLLFDRQLKSDVQVFTQTARDVAEEFASGRGTLGRLLKEEGPYNDFRAIVADTRKMVERVKRGEGPLGMILFDELVAENVRNFAAALDDQDATIGKLLHDRSFARNLEGTITDLREIVAHVRSGKGTLGRILMDDSLVRGLEGAVTALTGTVNEAREAAPVNAFLQTLFIWF